MSDWNCRSADIQATASRCHLHFLDVKSQRRCSLLDFWLLAFVHSGWSTGVYSKMFTKTFSLHLHECIDGVEHGWQCAPCWCPVWRKHRTPRGVLVPVRVVMCRQRNTERLALLVAVGLGYVTTRHFFIGMKISSSWTCFWLMGEMYVFWIMPVYLWPWLNWHIQTILARMLLCHQSLVDGPQQTDRWERIY